MFSNASVAITTLSKPGFLEAMAASERWLVPSAILTFCLGFFSLLSLHDHAGAAAVLLVLPAWFAYAAIIGVIYYTIHCAKRGIKGPFSRLTDNLRSTFRTLLPAVVLILLSGLNMIALMWTKPVLNYAIPFWADPLLADMDNALFFGTDPWKLVSGLNTPFFATIYHSGWPVFMMLALIIASVQPPSQKKAAMITTYFMVWTVVGPLIHSLLPAGGPIFYESLGYGDRFAKMVPNAQTYDVVQYLWNRHENNEFGPSAGISAMPSMHVATTTWAVLCIHVFARRWHVWAAAFGLLIVALSVALGWHYLMDGIVGATATLVAYWCTMRLFAKRSLAADDIPA
jgi:PAP2 superfamily